MIKTVFNNEALEESKKEKLKYPPIGKENQPLKKQFGKISCPEYCLRYINYSSLQDHSVLAANSPSIDQPKSIGLTIKLPKVDQASNIDASVIGKEFNLSAGGKNGAKYELKLLLPYSVQEDPTKAAFDIGSGELNLEFATLKNKDESISSGPTDSGIECETGYRTNSDADTSSVSSQEEFFECKIDDSTSDETKDCVGARKFVLTPFRFTQSETSIFMRVELKGIDGNSIQLRKIDSQNFQIKYHSVGQSLAPLAMGGFLSTTPFFFDEIKANVLDEDRFLIDIKKNKKEKWHSVRIGLGPDSLTEVSIEEV